MLYILLAFVCIFAGWLCLDMAHATDSRWGRRVSVVAVITMWAIAAWALGQAVAILYT